MKKEKLGDKRGTGEDTNLGQGYWHLAGAETKATVAANSTVCREFLIRCMKAAGKNGILRFPEFLKDFDHGLLIHAKGAKGFSIQWVSLLFNDP